MMLDPYRGCHSTRSSLIYPPEAAASEPRLIERLQRQPGVPGSFYGHIFVEDASDLLPWVFGPYDAFTAPTPPPTPELDELVCNALAGSDGVPAARLEDGIRQHLQRAAAQLILGEAIYEIEYLTTSAEPTGPPVGFRIAWMFPPGSVDRVRRHGVHRRYVQYVPNEWGGTDTLNGLHYRELNQQNLVVLRLDRRWRRSLRHALAVMVATGSPDGTAHRMQATPHSDFDPARFKARMAQEVLAATRAVGWPGRFSFDDQMLLPYRVWRHLQFQRFKIDLRDCILDGLRTTLQRATERLDKQAKLELAGLLTSAEIDQAEAELKAGSLHFDKLRA